MEYRTLRATADRRAEAGAGGAVSGDAIVMRQMEVMDNGQKGLFRAPS
jgi:hypothetical protein